MEWYSVKFLSKITITGEPDRDRMDDHFSDTRLYFEESVVLVRADSFDHAFVLAVNNAKKEYSAYENKYGQKVTWEFDRTLDCFRLPEAPGSFAKVYSTLFPVRAGENIGRALHQRYEACSPENAHELRRRERMRMGE